MLAAAFLTLSTAVAAEPETSFETGVERSVRAAAASSASLKRADDPVKAPATDPSPDLNAVFNDLRARFATGGQPDPQYLPGWWAMDCRRKDDSRIHDALLVVVPLKPWPGDGPALPRKSPIAWFAIPMEPHRPAGMPWEDRRQEPAWRVPIRAQQRSFLSVDPGSAEAKDGSLAMPDRGNSRIRGHNDNMEYYVYQAEELGGLPGVWLCWFFNRVDTLGVGRGASRIPSP